MIPGSWDGAPQRALCSAGIGMVSYG